MYLLRNIIFNTILFLLLACNLQSQEKFATGAERTSQYFHLLKDKKVGLVVNASSLVNEVHLIDTLLSADINVSKIFAPEHGLRGTADAGEVIKDGIDQKSGLPVYSLYGKNKKPSQEMLEGLDVVIFDIQDVGVRFYTYISTMHYVMEACAEANIPLMILDRPNPNGHYIDGPVLEPKYSSFVGMHPIPIVHGLTVAELARMINGEGWLENKDQCALQIIPMSGYTHSMPYELPVKPSPNLPNKTSIAWYPTLCLFEPTNISVGRGTYEPFQIYGAPIEGFGPYKFTPVSIEGMSKYPKHENKTCYGYNLENKPLPQEIRMDLIIEAYNKYPEINNFFTSEGFFIKLSGTDKLLKQIKEGKSAEEIKDSWREDLKNYKELRKRYLLY
ncbi:DUF1343 domain-containing protein [Mangrovivirga sp. M17]|uniref:DUF1343 domain-containing protein n=1 Tax=Mangrovivirga halotolerans TaxID=2993936 RepID=A0ABT3RMC8_9BACT|nr:DUF1343 domain-containing protein [Mangrovivirga halotolerans]MCX2742513.1 DUF1343 domain-containing protein [Mangrovivirga halotolerans]